MSSVYPIKDQCTLLCLPTLSWFCMVNVGHIYTIPWSYGYINTTSYRPHRCDKGGQIAIAAPVPFVGPKLGRECSPRVSRGVFMGLKSGIFWGVSPHAGVHQEKKSNRKMTIRFFGENLWKLQMISVFLPCKSKGGLVLSSGICFANKHNDVQSISNDFWFRWQRNVTLVSGKMAENIPFMASQPIYP